MKKLKKVLHKLWKLNEISFGRKFIYFEQNCVISDEMIEEIIENCNKLTQLFFGRNVVIEREVQKKFFDKFGKQLISITEFRQNFDFTFIKAPNIEELIVSAFDPQLSQMEFNKLKSFCGQVFAKDLDSFEIFIENNAKTLEYMEITFDEKRDDEQSATKLMKNNYKIKKFGSFEYFV